MLAHDSNPDNDRQMLTLFGQRPPVLFLEQDQVHRVRTGETRSFRFSAELQGDAGDVVKLVPPAQTSGWKTQLYDADNATPLPLNGDAAELGFLEPYSKVYFNLEVETPQTLTGAVDSLCAKVRGFARGDSNARDSVLLVLLLVPELGIHNFPNPLEDATTFVIGLPDDGTVKLTIYDRSGELISHVLRSRTERAGVHRIGWSARNDRGGVVAPGTYHYLLEFTHEGKTDLITKKLVITRK